LEDLSSQVLNIALCSLDKYYIEHYSRKDCKYLNLQIEFYQPQDNVIITYPLIYKIMFPNSQNQQIQIIDLIRDCGGTIPFSFSNDYFNPGFFLDGEIYFRG